MKKVIKCLGMMALVAVAFTSCKKEEVKSTISLTSQEFTIDDEDRAYMSEKMTYFEIGDRVMVFNISETTPTQSSCGVYESIGEGTTVRFVNSGMGEAAQDALDAGYYAYYPWVEPFENIITELGYGENKSKFHVQPEQTYRPGKVSLNDLYMAGHSDAENLTSAVADFEMQNIMGVLKLKPYEAAKRTVTQIQVVDCQYHLSGWVELIIPEVNPVELRNLINNYAQGRISDEQLLSSANTIKNRMGYNVTDGGYSITLNVPGGVQLTDNKATTPEFNIVLRPLALSKGFHIIFTFADGSVKDCDLSANHNICIVPNNIKSVKFNMDNY